MSTTHDRHAGAAGDSSEFLFEQMQRADRALHEAKLKFAQAQDELRKRHDIFRSRVYRYINSLRSQA